MLKTKQGAQIRVLFLDLLILTAGIEPNLEKRHQCLGDVELEAFVGIVIDRKGVAVVQIFQLPFTEPDEILLGHGTVFHDLTHGNRALKDVKKVARILLAAGKINHSLRLNARQGHPAEPFPYLAIVLASVGFAQYPYQSG